MPTCSMRDQSRHPHVWHTCDYHILVAAGVITTLRLGAQIATGGITGTVKDTSGAVIADSQVSSHQ